MKLLLSLILILSITFTYANEFKFAGYRRSTTSSSSSVTQNCFTDGSTSDVTGYTAQYAIVSFNGVLPGHGNPVESSFSEEGYINMDFINNRMVTDFFLESESGPSFGKLYAFGGNQTQYVIPKVNGVETCYSGALSFEIPAPSKVIFQGDYTLGTYPIEGFKVVNNNPSTNDTLSYVLVGKQDCSLTSNIVYNAPNSGVPPGTTQSNFFEFNPVSNPSDFYLPSVCSNPTPIPSNAHALNKLNIKLPTSLNNRFI